MMMWFQTIRKESTTKFVNEEWISVPASLAKFGMLHDFLSKMLQIDPAKRIKIEEVLQRPWFTTELEASITGSEEALHLY